MKRKALILLVLALGAALLLRPAEASQAVRSGLGMCAATVIPALFPFFVVLSLLLKLGAAALLPRLCGPFLGPLFHLRGICAGPLLAGLMGGYPAGAQTAAQLYEEGLLSRKEAEVCLGFCNNCGPAFLLSYAGVQVLGSSRAGGYLWLIHVASALLTGMILCRIAGMKSASAPLPALPGSRLPAAQALPQAVSGAAQAIVSICAFVVFFSVVTALLPLTLPPAAAGILELVSGLSGLTPGRSGFVTAAALAGWGGLSVHCQTMAVIGGLSARWHWAGKALQAGLSAALALAVTALW